MASTLLLGVSAVNTGNNLLFLIVAAMLAFMATTGVLGWLNIRGLTLNVHLPDEVYAGTDTFLSITLHNAKKFLPSFLIRVAVLGETTSFLLVERKRPQSGALLLSFPVRGPLQLAEASISSPFPVNFFIRATSLPIHQDCTVFPAPRPLQVPAPGGKPDAGEAAATASAGYDGELAKISDYRGGEPLKLIHWRLSAKHEVFKVKELTATAAEPLLLELDSIPGRDVEQRLSFCTFLVNRLIKGGRPVGLKLGERVIPPGSTRSHRLRLLTELGNHGKN
ncbi:DUF58 domain-containing protein [Geomonas oryzisoli]|uniref:DUF58 domain-containing protein n=1 Tax=Geomonas oryzisoli TaxID=2847992 RepID=UPI001EF04644|nr:DUF58 domain-containing protein [Geomonas oryzisoli]